MAQPHELDKVYRIGDGMDDVGEKSSLGSAVGSSIRFERGRFAGPLSSELILCLGAGQAYPELDLVGELGIPHQNVVLLDRRFSNEARKRFQALAPQATIVESGMFSYLQSAEGMQFSNPNNCL